MFLFALKVQQLACGKEAAWKFLVDNHCNDHIQTLKSLSGSNPHDTFCGLCFDKLNMKW